jgi:ATP-dependent DNA ligase
MLNTLRFYFPLIKIIEKIIRLTIPSNLDKENNEEMRMQYKFDSLIQKFIEEHMGFDKKTIKENGDLSLFIMNNFKKKRETQDYSLTINKVYESKEEVLNTIGQFSQNERILIIKELFDKCYERLEAYYISKIFLNRMKLGFGQKSVVSSLNQMKDTISIEDYESLCKVLENVFRHNLILNKDNISPGISYTYSRKFS